MIPPMQTGAPILEGSAARALKRMSTTIIAVCCLYYLMITLAYFEKLC